MDGLTIIRTVFLVFFVVNAVLLILLVLIQNDEGGGLGGMFGGGSNTAFGSRSGNVLTRATTVLGSLFLIISLSLAIMSKTSIGNVERAGMEQSIEDAGVNWLMQELNPTPVISPEDFIIINEDSSNVINED